MTCVSCFYGVDLQEINTSNGKRRVCRSCAENFNRNVAIKTAMIEAIEARSIPFEKERERERRRARHYWRRFWAVVARLWRWV